jgi:hypothetical protein
MATRGIASPNLDTPSPKVVGVRRWYVLSVSVFQTFDIATSSYFVPGYARESMTATCPVLQTINP